MVNTDKLFYKWGDGDRGSPYNRWVVGSIPAPPSSIVVGRTPHPPCLLVVVRGSLGTSAWQPDLCQTAPVACHHQHVCVFIDGWMTVVWSVLGSFGLDKALWKSKPLTIYKFLTVVCWNLGPFFLTELVQLGQVCSLPGDRHVFNSDLHFLWDWDQHLAMIPPKHGLCCS